MTTPAAVVEATNPITLQTLIFLSLFVGGLLFTIFKFSFVSKKRLRESEANFKLEADRIITEVRTLNRELTEKLDRNKELLHEKFEDICHFKGRVDGFIEQHDRQ